MTARAEGSTTGPSHDVAWAAEQVAYLLSTAFESALRERADDALTVEVAVVLSELAGRLAGAGAPEPAQRAAVRSVRHLLTVADRDVSALVARGLRLVVDTARLVARDREAAGEPGPALECLESAVPFAHDLAAGGDPVPAGAFLVRAGQQAWEAGLDDRALAHHTAAVEVLRSVADAEAESSRVYGHALSARSTALWRVGRVEEALEASSAAVPLFRRLAAAEPGRYGPDLATVLKNCAVTHHELAHHAAAAGAAREAARWAGERDGTPSEGPAAMRLLEAKAWIAAGEYPRARAAALDAAERYRLLVAELPRLAGALHTARSLVALAARGAN